MTDLDIPGATRPGQAVEGTTARPPAMGTLTIDLRASRDSRFDSLAGATRSRIRRALEGIQPGDFVQLRVNRWSISSDVDGLIPDGVRVQISADDVTTLREWQTAMAGSA